MRILAWVLFALLPLPAAAQTSFSGNLEANGQVGVGTLVPRARLDVMMSTSDQYGLKVSSADGSSMLLVDKAGSLGIGVSAPGARADLRGMADSGDVGLQLRLGNSSSTASAVQIIFASSAGTFQHGLRTSAFASQNLGNAVDFYLWRSTGQPAAMGNLKVLSLAAVPAASTGSVHVAPAGISDVELEVSDGTTTGGGTIHRAAAGTHSSRRLKSDIVPLGRTEEETAYSDVKGLRHALFRYKSDRPSSPLRRGLVYEDVPDSLRGPRETVVLDYRILNLELALKAAHRRIEDLEALAAALEAGGRR